MVNSALFLLKNRKKVSASSFFLPKMYIMVLDFGIQPSVFGIMYDLIGTTPAHSFCKICKLQLLHLADFVTYNFCKL